MSTWWRYGRRWESERRPAFGSSARFWYKETIRSIDGLAVFHAVERLEESARNRFLPRKADLRGGWPMKSWRIALLTICGWSILLIGHKGAPFSVPAFGQEKEAPSQKTVESLEALRKGAEQGDAVAQVKLGVGYELGEGVPQDYAEAVRWYRKAAEQGAAPAQFNLGRMYNSGQGVPQDYAEAALWYRKAAEQGHARAQFLLGTMYGLGKGVPRDYVQAHKWLNLAASLASGEAQTEMTKVRDIFAGKMTAQQMAEAQRLAREWKTKSDEDSSGSPQQPGFTADNVNGRGWRLMDSKQKLSYVSGLVDGIAGLIFLAQANNAPYEPLRQAHCELVVADSRSAIVQKLDSYYQVAANRDMPIPMALYTGFGIMKGCK